MFAGNQKQVLGLWVAATGVVIVGVGVVGFRSESRGFLHFFHSDLASALFVLIGFALIVRGFAMYRTEKMKPPTFLD